MLIKVLFLVNVVLLEYPLYIDIYEYRTVTTLLHIIGRICALDKGEYLSLARMLVLNH